MLKIGAVLLDARSESLRIVAKVGRQQFDFIFQDEAFGASELRKRMPEIFCSTIGQAESDSDLANSAGTRPCPSRKRPRAQLDILGNAQSFCGGPGVVSGASPAAEQRLEEPPARTRRRISALPSR